MKHLRSLREFIVELDKIGEVQSIEKKVDWNLEIGAVSRRSYELRAPAPLFSSITGIDKGLRVLAAPGGLSAQPGLTFSRIALALGLPATARGADIVTALADARTRQPIPPKIVETGPCKDNVMLGADVDLLKFPTPLIHDGDGGRYIQTWGMNIARTPDGSWTNWSINRMMLVDRNRLACLIPPLQHLGIIKARWEQAGTPMPIAVALGVEPGLPYVGGMPLPEGADESHFLGAYFGEPLELVRAETVDLLVPATAEIVIEGYVSHTDTFEEGPMGEYPGYLDRASSAPQPVLHVTAVTYRDDAILPVAVAGAPVEEDHTGWGLPHAAEMLHVLRSAELPVAACWGVLESACHLWVVAVDRDWHARTGLSSREFAQRIGEVVFGAGKLAFGVPKLLVVENDIDISDPLQVIWAFTSRAHPEHSEIHFDNEPQNILPIYLEAYERLSYHSTKVVYNCLLADRFAADEQPVPADFAHNWTPQMQQHVLDNWRAYGYR
ncbi:UbiD family decarboxylase [Nocardia sp. NEAU-G5]|uniref:Pyrrole-2-carboxylic acid decarboxylase n=1 Tax=Nocardia albiluteola TaxID=2842303 RepID=A0ABS6AZE2_9NOCA|nr:UbiD family decarboxylase [Nocardia albiluteola]MBU3062369.1 UbiD family decarboxylase [Nocardia albiluteola]